MKSFNTTAVCIPSKHYMVDLSERVREIKKMVDAGKYFTINRARQYGKTTTLAALKNALKDEYITISLDFQSLDNDVFEKGATFSQALARILIDASEFGDLVIPEKTFEALKNYSEADVNRVKMDELFRIFKRWFKDSETPVVLMIDEVDSATNNQVFLDFLAQLREGYISRDRDGIPAFHSVILAGVRDVKYIEVNIRDDEDAREIIPWNIAADFNIDMSLSKAGIKGMLDEYEADHDTGMDTEEMAGLIRDYTNGYPFLVSRICQLIDEEVSKKMDITDAWTRSGIDEAVKLILSENNTLFQSITKNLNNLPELKASIRSILMEGRRISWNIAHPVIAQMQTYGLAVNDNNRVRISNRIFENGLYNYFFSEGAPA